ncbi:hypothetical protein [Thermanaeromonas sp. C210]|uniref:hypothetical protein n=1 Tax=Thermanaeromonas sp. C210 TaxID=2731925 RepID=UPI00155C5983|nr:hypothetical protein [Thermanaeromonas sp. C210]GFN22106.1 hypothetical protein TAMC210_04220 [Thermanaeromonas sp. C210]
MAAAGRVGSKDPAGGYIIKVIYTGSREEGERALKEARRHAFQRLCAAGGKGKVEAGCWP